MVETLVWFVVEVDVKRDCGSRKSKVKFCNRYLVIYPVYDATEYRFKRYTGRKNAKGAVKPVGEIKSKSIDEHMSIRLSLIKTKLGFRIDILFPLGTNLKSE